MGNERALAASAEETTAKAFSSQSDECEIVAERCSLRGLRVRSSRLAGARRAVVALGLIFRRHSAQAIRQNLSPSHWVTLHSTSPNSGDPSN